MRATRITDPVAPALQTTVGRGGGPRLRRRWPAGRRPCRPGPTRTACDAPALRSARRSRPPPGGSRRPAVPGHRPTAAHAPRPHVSWCASRRRTRRRPARPTRHHGRPAHMPPAAHGGSAPPVTRSHRAAQSTCWADSPLGIRRLRHRSRTALAPGATPRAQLRVRRASGNGDQCSDMEKGRRGMFRFLSPGNTQGTRGG